jgi:hypothetical protein
MPLIKATTHPRPIPKPSASVSTELRDEPDAVDGCGGPDGIQEVEVDMVDVDIEAAASDVVVMVDMGNKDDQSAASDVIVVGVISPKKDDAMADIVGAAAASMPLQSATRGCFSGVLFLVRLQYHI